MDLNISQKKCLPVINLDTTVMRPVSILKRQSTWSRRPSVSFLRGKVLHRTLKSGKYPLGCSSMCWLSWFSGPGFCSCPCFHLGLGASDCSPGLAFCCMGSWTLLGSAARSSPTSRAKTGCTTHVCTAQGGTRRLKLSCARLRVPPVALHVSQLISWIL